MLGKIIRVVEMDNSLLVRLNNVRIEKQALGNILAYLARHIVPLNAVDGRVLIGVFLLYFLVIALNKA